MLKGCKHSEETKRKMSVARRGRKISEESKRKSSETQKGRKRPEISGEKNFFFGKREYGLSNRSKKKPPFSEEHRKKLGDARRGENNGNWRGGITKENEKSRYKIGYRLWRRSCLERDGFTCQKYLTKGGALRVHHINNFAEFPELRLALDNGITLSEKAHKEFHKKYGVKNNTKEQLNEYLNG